MPAASPRSDPAGPLVELGRVAKPHGVRGELRVHLHYAGSDTLLHAPSAVFCSASGVRRECRIERARRAYRSVLIKLAGLDTIEAVQSLRGAAVLVPRAALSDPEDGEFYLCDLVGARVITPAGELGRVVEVVSHPSVDSLIIRTSDGGTVEQPLSEPWVGRVDPAERIVELASVDGLIV